MKILSLLRMHLKDDEIIELLEQMDLEVVYDFDRLHENAPDAYWAKAEDHGITLRFNESQRLDTVFIYLQPCDGHQAVDRSLIEDVPFFDSDSQVRTHAAAHGIRFVERSRPTGGLLPPGSWVRLDYDHHRIHYDFRGGTLTLVTVSSASELPAA